MSSSNCCFLTCIQVSQEAGQMVWYSHLFQNFPQFIVIHTVRGFGVVNKAEIDVFLELSWFFQKEKLSRKVGWWDRRQATAWPHYHSLATLPTTWRWSSSVRCRLLEGIHSPAQDVPLERRCHWWKGQAARCPGADGRIRSGSQRKTTVHVKHLPSESPPERRNLQ